MTFWIKKNNGTHLNHGGDVVYGWCPSTLGEPFMKSHYDLDALLKQKQRSWNVSFKKTISQE